MSQEPIRLVDLFHKEDKPVNRQLFEQNPEAQALAEAYQDMEGGFHNPLTPNLVIQHEKVQHRLVLLLKLKGLTNREVAAQVGMTEAWVSQITRQSWFQERMTEALLDTEGEIIDKIVEVEAKNSIYKLVQLRDTAKSEDVQARCAMEILNRHLGKPVSRVETQTNVFHVTTKLEDLDRKLREVEEAEKALLTRGATVVPVAEQVLPESTEVGRLDRGGDVSFPRAED